ncbi:8041_t:CDS:2 [Gigaspora margarita]|uniref:8041_t:CDS:1 n=1 Tax=Gigaspora margarita TaxID=4874 RepID=A0ABN7VPP8_GIGMA|nr:8041_t:CDS:2 [Gigaspora margarita]
MEDIYYTSKNDNKLYQEVQKCKTTPVKASRNDNTKSNEKWHLKASKVTIPKRQNHQKRRNHKTDNEEKKFLNKKKDKKAAMKLYQHKPSNDDEIILVKVSK